MGNYSLVGLEDGFVLHSGSLSDCFAALIAVCGQMSMVEAMKQYVIDGECGGNA